MQAAVDIVNDSPHPTNKIAATIAGEGYALSRTNLWPKAITKTLGNDVKIGNSSSTIHAETACILAAPKTLNASIFVTDPPCPNCMKNMAEAGISALYIDHKGFDKDWAKRRGNDFQTMSMRVAAKAGMDVFVIYRKEQKYEVISTHPPGYKPKIENPAKIEKCDNWGETLSAAKSHYADEPFALGYCTDAQGHPFSILVDRHPTIGYTYETVENKQDKYSFILQPINRLLMIAAKQGLTLDPEYIYTSRIPTSREFVNFIGAGFTKITIGDPTQSRDEHGLTALLTLTKSNTITVKGETS